MAGKGDKCHKDAEAVSCHPAEADENDGSVPFSDAEDQSRHSPYHSHGVGSSCDELRISNASASEASRSSCVSDCSAEIGLEGGVPEIKINVPKAEKDCRICHLSLVGGAQESGPPIELGCSCKDDLAAAHKQCAQAWFKIRGNKTCEVCGSVAKNVAGAGEADSIEQWNETSGAALPSTASENRGFWHRHRFLNFLLACLVFAFIISWLLHVNVPS